MQANDLGSVLFFDDKTSSASTNTYDIMPPVSITRQGDKERNTSDQSQQYRPDARRKVGRYR